MSPQNPQTEAELLARIRELSRVAWPNWFRSPSTRVPEPRHVDPAGTAGGPQWREIQRLEANRTIAIADRRLGEAELLEVKQRETMVDLVARKPPQLREALAWLADVASAADMLSNRRSDLKPRYDAAGLDRIEGLADQLFLHVLPWLVERHADAKTLAQRVEACTPEARALMESFDGAVPCPMGIAPRHERYETRMARNRARWSKRAKSPAVRGASGPRKGSLNAARLEIRRRAEKSPITASGSN